MQKYNMDYRDEYYQKEYELYFDRLDDIRDLIIDDLGPACPEFDCIESDVFENAYKSQSETCNLITRYYEDDNYARAYAVSPYKEGIMILMNKKSKEYNIIVIGEDDGCWFPTHYYDGIRTDKHNFISLVSEALGIFNSNFDSSKTLYG